MTDARILVGDCREQLANIADNSIDAIITDPPYELGFMGKTWDNSGVACDIATWAECLRVLKPGGHLCAFGGTRTYHRMTVAIEDAGFEIRDSIHWIYGSGFPKSLDVSKAIDKQRHDRADILRVTAWVRSARDAAGIGNRQIDDAFGFVGMAGHWTSSASQPAVPTLEQIPTLLDVLGVTLDDVPDDIRQLIWTLNTSKGQPGENWWKREVVGTREVWGRGVDRLADIGHDVAVDGDTTIAVTAPATDAARQWEGWGTALKPAHEPIVLARKPFPGTVANNVLEHGTGALNIDGTRIDMGAEYDPDKMQRQQNAAGSVDNAFGAAALIATEIPTYKPGGRWPANLLITHHHACTDDTCTPDCPTAILNRQSTTTDTSGASRYFTQTCWDPDADVASFRYVAKSSKRERNTGLDTSNTHPTVKPVALIRWLIRLTTTADATILDPFLGSGTTAVAATLEGRNWIGCELTPDYLPLIEGRTAWAERNNDTAAPVVPTNDTTTTTADPTLFGDPE